MVGDYLINLTVSVSFNLETMNVTELSSGVPSDCGLLVGGDKDLTLSLDASGEFSLLFPLYIFQLTYLRFPETL